VFAVLWALGTYSNVHVAITATDEAETKLEQALLAIESATGKTIERHVLPLEDPLEGVSPGAVLFSTVAAGAELALGNSVGAVVLDITAQDVQRVGVNLLNALSMAVQAVETPDSINLAMPGLLWDENKIRSDTRPGMAEALAALE
jgi:hypothetical protein